MKGPLWTPSPSRIEKSQMTAFIRKVEARCSRRFETFPEFYQWTVDNLEEFWQVLWEEGGFLASQPPKSVLAERKMLGGRWFEGARLNFARNLLRFRDHRTAIVSLREHREPVRMTFREVYRSVAACASGLRRAGVGVGDRVAGFVPNVPESVIAMLAATSLGALWSSCSPDFGRQGVLDRFGQIEPKVLFTADGYQYQGKRFDSLGRAAEIASSLPTLESLVVFRNLAAEPLEVPEQAVSWEDFTRSEVEEIEFEELPFDHPVYIMYSSGTTGAPKCMVHGAGGTLLQHYKEHVLHTDLSGSDVLIYFTTCGWMMWNWLVSALQLGTTIVLYDGSPAFPDPGVLWRLVEAEGITAFGTSPKFLTICQQRGVEPGRTADLSSLKAILSTGSPLSAENFDWVYSAVKKDVQLASISGGTDLISCFMLGNPVAPVYSEEIQTRGLGMKVEAFDGSGRSVIDQVGELVCTAPFPSRPVFFWNDPDDVKYQSAYFNEYPGVWRHGDFVKITPRGGVVMYGRSDATLNPGGVRIGTAEIYGPVEALDEVADSIVIGQQWKGDVRVVLFVVLAPGVPFTRDLEEKIRRTVREATTPRHVPAVILPVKGVPYTLNGKKVELAVSHVVHAQPVTNRDALANPEILDCFSEFPELRPAG